ncbi:GNAT family N-acetyltransferase [Neoactinobaculum massilliense]|uniref:GNAT family N-acetyltransferase n=1 Tax=Neoactinobaculum massilliense TaxID=2364794 RepID=UPI000F5392F0|nr:GNAT family N-acetyltransferase [Neoactinobaculum massilliense]
MITIQRDATEAFTVEINALIRQLSSSAPALTREQVTALLDQQALSLFVARDNAGSLLGMLSLVVFNIPTGRRAWIEDVVVTNAARGQGIGRQLVEAAVTHAHELGARTVDLTSRPSREAANRLYQRSGFVARETNVYRFADQ